jgi:hypothetical protein
MVPNHDRAVANRPIVGSAPLLCGIGTAKKFADPSHIAREGLSLIVGEPTKGQFMRSCHISVSENIRRKRPIEHAWGNLQRISTGKGARLAQPSLSASTKPNRK